MLLVKGPLGAGKTTFAQGVAEGLGFHGVVTSPTFDLVHEYVGGRITLVHIDTYRLNDAAEVEGIGFDEYLERDVVNLVEWPERLGSCTPVDRLEVVFRLGESGSREVVFSSYGERYDQLLSVLDSRSC